MISIYWKEITGFFSSLIGYIVLVVFLLLIGSFTWLWQDTSILQYNYAGLDPLFSFAPLVFLFLVPAITMRSFAEEYQSGTIEFISTQPLTDWHIILAKFFANLSLVVLAILPTMIYYFSVYRLGSPPGNLDSGGIIGSYIGLIFLSGFFVSIGIFCSSVTSNQIIAFILSAAICFFIFFGFSFLASFPSYVGSIDDILERLGASHHYESLSRGVIDSRDVIYFVSGIVIMLAATNFVLQKRKW